MATGNLLSGIGEGILTALDREVAIVIVVEGCGILDEVVVVTMEVRDRPSIALSDNGVFAELYIIRLNGFDAVCRQESIFPNADSRWSRCQTAVVLTT
jgi:hypothetical protein